MSLSVAQAEEMGIRDLILQAFLCLQELDSRFDPVEIFTAASTNFFNVQDTNLSKRESAEAAFLCLQYAMMLAYYSPNGSDRYVSQIFDALGDVFTHAGQPHKALDLYMAGRDSIRNAQDLENKLKEVLGSTAPHAIN